jgi:hypothetical protein
VDTIEVTDSFTSCIGRDAVEIFRLTALCSALRLELRGVRVTRRRTALAVAKGITGLRTNDRLAQIAHLELRLDELRKGVRFKDERTTVEVRI